MAGPMKTLRTILKTLASMSLAVSSPSAVIDNGPVFPGRKWEEATPESQRIDSARLRDAVALLERTVGTNGVEELVIVRNGRIVWAGDEVDRVHGIWSFTKSFASTVLGLLIEDRKCTLDDPAAKYVAALAKDYSTVTLRHFVTMTSGYRAEGDEPVDGYLHGPSKTPFAPNPQPLFTPPGSQYAYWDSAMNQFGHVLTRIAGEPLEAIFKRRIADPIGMRTNKWLWGHFEVDGLKVNGGSGNAGRHVQISAREAARFGLLFLNKGNWGGRQLISARWVEEATRLHVPATTAWAQPESDIDGRGVYGLNWWVNGVKPDGSRKFPAAPAGMFWASGHNNNKCFVVPEWNMVIVRLGLDGKAPDKVWNDFLAALAAAVTK
jgi:CubicO group peptidase (beta-lactamase class C family)